MALIIMITFFYIATSYIMIIVIEDVATASVVHLVAK